MPKVSRVLLAAAAFMNFVPAVGRADTITVKVTNKFG